jgi:tetratricopeptide (TPR) repeat protein
MARPMPTLLIAALLAGLAAPTLAWAGDAEDCHKLSGEAAIRACSAVLAQNPNDATALLNRGAEYAVLGQHDRAIADYDKALVLKPFANGFYNRGNAYRAKGQNDRALADYDKAIALRPDYTMALFNRGSLHRALGQNDRAIADFDKFIALKPDSADAYTFRANAYRAKGDNERAIADYDKVLALAPNDATALNGRGNAFRSIGDRDRAIADYSKVIAQLPEEAAAYYNRSIAYYEKGLHDLALADSDRVVAMKSDFADAYTNRGLIHRAKGNYERAIADYDKAMALKPADPDNFNNRGNVYRDRGDYDRAIADYDRAIALKLDFRLAHDNRRAAVELRDKAKATASTGATTTTAAHSSASIPAGARVALVVGNGAYGQMGRLRNPANDAAAVGKALTGIGFSVEVVTDANRETMARSLRAFSDKADRAEIALVYYSGHAVQIPRGGAMENYLLPVDARLSDIRDAEDEAIGLSRVMERVARAKTRIVILDACRDNPFAAQIASATRSTPARGLARLSVPNHGSLVVYSTAPQDVAADGDGEVSPFTKAFVETVATKGLDARLMIGRVRSKVFEATGGRQTPYSDDGLLQEVYLGGP